jgi:energy-coupling factor transporter ATP-binding protein EcfA2
MLVKAADTMSDLCRHPGHLSLPGPYKRLCRGAVAVSFAGAAKAFGAVRAVDGIDLDIPRGETVALLGRNGAGKSTAISLMLGLNDPDAGQVRIFGRTPGQVVTAGRVSAMLQDGAPTRGRPIPRVPVRELVTFVARTYPRPLPVRDLDGALAQITDIEAVGRQALTEIREAVTGYREGTLATELDRARSALTAAGIEPVVRQSGPPPEPETAALLGWVVREAVTNAVRHSGASHCEITVTGTPDRARATITDDDPGTPAASTGSGTGLKGLTERLTAAGGYLEAGRSARGGFRVSAELPVDAVENAESALTDRPGQL